MGVVLSQGWDRHFKQKRCQKTRSGCSKERISWTGKTVTYLYMDGGIQQRGDIQAWDVWKRRGDLLECFPGGEGNGGVWVGGTLLGHDAGQLTHGTRRTGSRYAHCSEHVRTVKTFLLIPLSPDEWDGRSAQYEWRTMCRRVSWLTGRPWLQPLLISAIRCFLKQNLDKCFSVRKGTMGNNLKPYSRGRNPMCVCVTWWNSSSTQLFMIRWIIMLYTHSLSRRFVLTKLRVIPKGSFSGFEDLEKM